MVYKVAASSMLSTYDVVGIGEAIIAAMVCMTFPARE